MKKPSLNRRLNRRRLGYWCGLAAAFVVAIVAGWTPLASEIDDYAYDWMFRSHPPAAASPDSMILAIDDDTFTSMGGVAGYRSMWTRAFELLKTARPKAVALDVVLADPWKDAAEDQRLARAMQGTKNLVLEAHLSDGRWEDPLPIFRRHAAAVGHDRADEISGDGVTRKIPLEERTASERHWALALEAFRLARGAVILESPTDLQIGDEVIPASRAAGANRPLRVVYTLNSIPQISLKQLLEKPELAARFNGKVVFIGVTSISASYDRVATPYGQGRIPGVEVHAQLFETLQRARFLTDASDSEVFGLCVLLAGLAGLIFTFLSGWPAYVAGAGLLVAAHSIPWIAFQHGTVLPYFGPAATAWLTAGIAATYQHFVVRRALRTSETERQRYQQAIRFVTHEMRTPLTAIQGSSELMGRYNLTEEKRKQMAEMINQESKRLARMIQTFLDVERLSEGQVELKRELFPVAEIVGGCLQRVRPLADRKNIQLRVEGIEGTLEGDRELMEYVVYNLLTNAVKYSGSETTIQVACAVHGRELRLSVQDQGMGMDAKELRQIFHKFYRTKRAEASGEAGTGIGLSIVDQIVRQHGGRMEVTSEPGRGSCFTVVLQARSRASQPPPVSV